MYEHQKILAAGTSHTHPACLLVFTSLCSALILHLSPSPFPCSTHMPLTPHGGPFEFCSWHQHTVQPGVHFQPTTSHHG